MLPESDPVSLRVSWGTPCKREDRRPFKMIRCFSALKLTQERWSFVFPWRSCWLPSSGIILAWLQDSHEEEFAITNWSPDPCSQSSHFRKNFPEEIYLGDGRRWLGRQHQTIEHGGKLQERIQAAEKSLYHLTPAENA